MTTSRRARVLDWALWDAGAASFHAIMTTFVFTVYLTSSSFGDPAATTQTLSLGLFVAGAVIALTAPVFGQRADRAGARRRALTLNTLAQVVCVAACWFVAPATSFLWLGVALLCAANVFNELATVHYNALLPRISGPGSVGRISGLGWSFGYFGGILALVLVLFGLIDPGFLGVPHHDALNLRAVALFSALWSILLSLPLLLRFPPDPPGHAVVPGPKESVAESYRRLGRTLRRLYREEPTVLRFLVSSAVFRDGLAGVFTYGGVLAAGSFGFAQKQVILFAIAGNVVAGCGAVLGGRLDDLLGPRRVVAGSLVGLLVAAAVLLAVPTGTMFWICGLLLCAFVGPAQSSARTYLSRITTEGREGEYFGLYSTTGRALSFLSPLAFSAFVALLGAQIWGILGIMVVLAAGLALAWGLPEVGRGTSPAEQGSLLAEEAQETTDRRRA